MIPQSAAFSSFYFFPQGNPKFIQAKAAFGYFHNFDNARNREQPKNQVNILSQKDSDLNATVEGNWSSDQHKGNETQTARETIGRLHLLIELYFGVNLAPAYGAKTKVDPTLTARLQNQF